MHELSIATAIWRLCADERAERPEAGPLLLARVAIGELSGVEPTLLAHAWEVVVAGELDDGARLEIDWCPVHQTCSACGEVAERQPGSWLRLCPDCSQPLVLEGGRELDLLSAEFQARPIETEVPAWT